MSSVRAFHPTAVKDYYLHIIDLGKTRGSISEHEAKLLTDFINSRKKKTGERVKPIRKTKIAQALITSKHFLKKDWTKATIKDLVKAVDEINESDYKQNSRNDIIRILKTFYKWLIRQKHTTLITLEQLSDEDDGIKAPGVDSETTEAKDLITRDELKEIINACFTHRDKALVAMIYESAARISEVARLRWGDLEYTEEGIVKLTIHDEKTKKKRYAPLLMAMEYIAAWRANYSDKPSDDALIFIDRNKKAMDYRTMAYQITRAAKRAGITKRCNPHVFRKSRLTEMVREGYQESVIKEVGWANQSSNMLKTYIKLGSDDVMNEFLIRQGLKKREQREKENLPQQCSFCFAMNSPVSSFCHKCGHPLTEEAKIQVKSAGDEIRQALVQDPAAQSVFLELLQQLKKGATS